MWPITSFGRNGISYSASPLTRSELYLHTLPLWTAGRIRLLDNPRIVDQFAGLRRKVGSGGRESVDHVRGAHDDIANCIAGCLWRLSPVYGAPAVTAPVLVSMPYADQFGFGVVDGSANDAAVTAAQGIPADGSGSTALMGYERG